MERINPFHATGLFLYPLKKSEKQRFSDVFRGYRTKPVAWKKLSKFCLTKDTIPIILVWVFFNDNICNSSNGGYHYDDNICNSSNGVYHQQQWRLSPFLSLILEQLVLRVVESAQIWAINSGGKDISVPFRILWTSIFKINECLFIASDRFSQNNFSIFIMSVTRKTNVVLL